MNNLDTEGWEPIGEKTKEKIADKDRRDRVGKIVAETVTLIAEIRKKIVRLQNEQPQNRAEIENNIRELEKLEKELNDLRNQYRFKIDEANPLADIPENAVTKEGFPRYKIIGPINAGAYGDVFLGEDTKIGHQVAIKKTLIKERTNLALANLVAEAKTMALFSAYNPDIITIYDLYKDGEDLCMVMEYDPNYESLHDHTYKILSDNKEPKERKEFLSKSFVNIAKAVDRIRKTLLHNDYKPWNILANKAGEIKIIDFGLTSRIYDNQKVVPGAPRYYGPDRVGKDNYDRVEDDITALALNYYFMLTGDDFFFIMPGDSEQEIQRRKIEMLANEGDETAWIDRAEKLRRTLKNLVGISDEQTENIINLIGKALKVNNYEKNKSQIRTQQSIRASLLGSDYLDSRTTPFTEKNKAQATNGRIITWPDATSFAEEIAKLFET